MAQFTVVPPGEQRFAQLRCVSPASGSSSGELAKSLACLTIPEGAAEGTYSGQGDASIKVLFARLPGKQCLLLLNPAVWWTWSNHSDEELSPDYRVSPDSHLNSGKFTNSWKWEFWRDSSHPPLLLCFYCRVPPQRTPHMFLLSPTCLVRSQAQDIFFQYFSYNWLIPKLYADWVLSLNLREPQTWWKNLR